MNVLPQLLTPARTESTLGSVTVESTLKGPYKKGLFPNTQTRHSCEQPQSLTAENPSLTFSDFVTIRITYNQSSWNLHPRKERTLLQAQTQ
jgi:hypothetical protein